MKQSATTFEGFFLPLLEELHQMPPGQKPGTMSQEFHVMRHQLAEKLWKQHALHLSQPEVKAREEDYQCRCTEFSRLISFIEDPTAISINFSFRGGFAHMCKVNPTNNTMNYNVTVRRTKDQLAMSAEKGAGAYYMRENAEPRPKNRRPRTPKRRKEVVREGDPIGNND
ncbi:hypothetical protein V491_03049 [Pseudogymnoascus sp. VKM F-3775]|nr:hypothetical protein V491_03049 [Pseudogymnoascus sp. VKM F-3775]